jgi:hypothetical protein
MRRIISTGFLSYGIAMASLSPALAGASCATGTGPVPEGTALVDSCMGNPRPDCPGQGPVFQCKDGKWYCLYNFTNRRPSQHPCLPEQAGAWVWTKNGLQRAQ